MPRNPNVIWAWLPAAAYMLLIWSLSAMPSQSILVSLPLTDKGAHFIEYGVLGFLFAHAVRGTWRHWRARLVFTVAVLASTLWGASDEIHQAFVPGRNSDVNDLIADALGALFGAGVYLVARAQWKRRAGVLAGQTRERDFESPRRQGAKK